MSNSTVRLKRIEDPEHESALEPKVATEHEPQQQPSRVEQQLPAAIELMAPRPEISARLFALLMLALVSTALGYTAFAAYRAFSDSFIAPMILSPDSEVVVTSMLKLGELAHERARTGAELQGIEAELTADEESLKRLHALQAKFQRAVEWTSQMSSQKAHFGVADLDALDAQGRITQAMLDEQTALTQKAEADVAAGLITRSEYATETQKLSELQRSLIDNRRNVLQGQAAMQAIALSARGTHSGKDGPLGPELMATEEQEMRVELEILRIESDRIAKIAVENSLIDRLAAIDGLSSQLKARPLYQAIEHNVNLAFVPYTQIDGVRSDARVYSCAWGLFGCTQVGLVREVLAGEVSQADPWGAPARGQYAVLNLWDHDAARAKTLRVRSTDRRTRPQQATSATVPAAQPAVLSTSVE